MDQSKNLKLDTNTLHDILPYLRRYARALSGSQESGDALAQEVLEQIADGRAQLKGERSVRVGLFSALHQILASTTLGIAGSDLEKFERRAQAHLAGLDQAAREALLLGTLEGFSLSEIAAIRGGTAENAQADIQRAQRAIAKMIAGKVMIIEDESVIAMDLSALVEDLGHQVCGVAPTYQAALKLGKEERPDLILADIKLADEKTGVDAVAALVGEFGVIPTIFVTAFPELYLSGKRVEPAFLISKPYTEDQVRTAVGQAMFFASTEAIVEVD